MGSEMCIRDRHKPLRKRSLAFERTSRAGVHLHLHHGATGTRLPRTKFSFCLNHPVPCAAHASRTATIFFCNCHRRPIYCAAATCLHCSLAMRAPRPELRGFLSPTALSTTLLRTATLSPRAFLTGQPLAVLPLSSLRLLLLQLRYEAAAALWAAGAAIGSK